MMIIIDMVMMLFAAVVEAQLESKYPKLVDCFNITDSTHHFFEER